MPPSTERRARLRLPVHWPVRITAANGSEETVQAVTENLSSQGFYCWVSRAFAPGECLDCVIELPHNSAQDMRRLRWRCQAEVVRSEYGPTAGTYGVACRIREYSIEVGEQP